MIYIVVFVTRVYSLQATSYACIFATSYERFVMDKELVIYAEATDQIEVGRALRAERAIG